ncbi:MAG: glycosyltransferase family 4 protein [Terracidiphilus sp.]
MNIAFLIAKDLFQGGGGIEKYTREVGRRLVARGHRVLVYSTRGTEPNCGTWEGIEIRWLPSLRPHWLEKLSGSFCAAAQAMWADVCPDLYHLHSVAAGAMAPLLGLRKVPCVLQMHGIEWQRSRWGFAGKNTLRLLESISFLSASAVTAVSRSQCEFYQRRYHSPITFIPTGTEAREPTPPSQLAGLGIEPGRYFFTAVRLVREKGIHYLIPAFRKCATGWKLVIAGAAGDDGSYLEMLRQLAGKDERILFLGHVREPLLGELYSHAGAYVQASEIEGMAISLLDAMSYGRCCIVSDIAENLDALGKAGLTFRSSDIDDLACQMHRAADLPDCAALLGEAARTRALAHFSWDTVTAQLEGLYLRTIEMKLSRNDAQRNQAKPV